MVSRLSIAIKIALVGILGALLLVSALSTQDITIKALDFSLGLRIFDQGYTEINVPPLGTIRARTHQMPLMFQIRLKNINLEQLDTMVTLQGAGSIFTDIQEILRQQVLSFILRILMVAFLGGLGAGFLFSHSFKKSLLAGLSGLLAFSILLGSAVLTYDETAFSEPEFEGIVEAAPWLMGVAEDALVAVQGLDAKLQIVTENLMVLFESLYHLEGGGGSVDGDIKLLHVSDIHNNPIGVSLAKQVATSFEVDIVIDTGDLTDYGTPIEADLLRNIEEIGLPWVFVPGNHDSPAVVQTMSQLSNVTVLLEDIVYFEDFDLTFAGMGDPAAQSSAMAVRPREEYQAIAARLRDQIELSEHKPSVIISHHPFAVEEFTDLEVLLLHGHAHQVDIHFEGNSVMVDAGTTGGAGIRGLMTRDEMPYTMVLLHLNRVEDGVLATAADVITVNQLNAGFVLERHRLHQLPLAQGDPQDQEEQDEGEGDGIDEESQEAQPEVQE